MPQRAFNRVQPFFMDLPPRDRDLAVFCMDLQLTMSKSRSDDEKQDLLEARIFK